MRPHFPRPFAAHQPEVAVGRAESESSAAQALLGADHPLVGLLRGLDTAFDQLVTVTALQAGAVVFMFGDFAFVLPLVIAAAVVQLALACRIAALRASRHDCCLRLIAEGDAGLPLRCVDTVCRHLRDPGTQKQLARSVDEIVEAVVRPRAGLGARPLLDVRVVRPTAPLLREVAALLRGSQPAVRGVAHVEWLITSPATPLYGSEAEPVRQQAARARYLLMPATSDPGSPLPITPLAPEVKAQRKEKVMESGQDVGSRDMKFAYTGMGLIILACIVISILA